MTERDFLAQLGAELRVGPLTKRRILLEISDHLEQAATPITLGGRAGAAGAVELMGPPGALAAEFSRTYAEHRRSVVRRASLVFCLGIAAMLGACAAILGTDLDGDRNFTPELALVIATVAILSFAVCAQRSRILALCLAGATIVWLTWSLRGIGGAAGVACLALLLSGLVGATALERFARSMTRVS